MPVSDACKNRLVHARQVVGSRPEFQVSKSMKPFSKTGVDYAGPFLTKQG